MFYCRLIVACHGCDSRQEFEASAGEDYPSLSKREGNIKLPEGWKWRTFKGPLYANSVYQDSFPEFPRGVYCPKCVEKDSTR